MPSLRHSSATLSSPRKPAITMRTFSSAEYNRRVARLISRTAFSASSECVSAFDLISAPFALKMSQKPSLPQSLQTVQLVLTGNREDLKLGIEHLSRWERVAVVTDVAWIRHAVGAFQFLMPGEVRVFTTGQTSEARKWI